MTYTVRLEAFEGPLDLLLHLVSQERLDVTEISISTITREYIGTLRALEEVDIDVASSFLVLAATLLELKSLKLLPTRSVDDTQVAALLEERDHLLHRLIVYSTFKSVVTALADLLATNEGYHPRTAGPPDTLIAVLPDFMEGVTAGRLARLAAAALAPRARAAVDTSFVAPIRVSVADMIDQLAERIRAERVTSFRELCREITGRLEVVVRFLALLELFRAESVEVEQSKPFGEIVVRWRQPCLGGGGRP